MKKATRCSIPNATPLIWLDIINKTNSSYIKFEEYVASLPAIVAILLQARIALLREKACRGELRYPHEHKNIRSAENLCEIRIENEHSGRTVQIRDYHLEPIDISELIGAHIHLKIIHPTKLETRLAQNNEIAIAVENYLQWRADCSKI